MVMPIRRWPLFLIAAPASIAVWSGWVGLGSKSGFGPIHPLPGVSIFGLDKFVLNTAITLPIGVEAYGAYAMGAWLRLPKGHPARKFARRSAIGSLVLGMLGQIAYHLLNAAHAATAPWPIVALVACLPVVVLGFGAGLTHLLGEDFEVEEEAETEEAEVPPDEALSPLEEMSAAGRPSLSAINPPEPEPILEPIKAGGSHALPKGRSWSRHRRAALIVAKNPEIKGAELGRKLGVTPRTGQRDLNRVRSSMDSA